MVVVMMMEMVTERGGGDDDATMVKLWRGTQWDTWGKPRVARCYLASSSSSSLAVLPVRVPSKFDHIR